MKINDFPKFELLHEQTKVLLSFENESRQEVIRAFEELNKEIDYDIVIKPKRKKRSLDANSYMWCLITKLSEKLHKPMSEVYQEYIKDNGVMEQVFIREEAIGKFVEIWKQKGLGWVCVDIGESRTQKGWHCLNAYYGSSTYDTKQMSRLIDAVVNDCKDQGIETLTPQELESLKENWK